MTTTDTLDIQEDCLPMELAEAGCEIVVSRSPARPVRGPGQIRKEIQKAKVDVPLVMDIHFMPNAAMEAAKHVERVSANPVTTTGKKFQIREYTDSQQRRNPRLIPPTIFSLVPDVRSHRSMYSTNYVCASDRIMNRFGDTPRGMAESVFEFIRMAESHGYHDHSFHESK